VVRRRGHMESARAVRDRYYYRIDTQFERHPAIILTPCLGWCEGRADSH